MKIKIPLEYQIIMGSFIAGLIISLFHFINNYRKESKQEGESQRLAIIAIIFGVLIFIPFAGTIGLFLAIISLFIKKFKTLSKIAIVVNIIALLPWLAVLIFSA